MDCNTLRLAAASFKFFPGSTGTLTIQCNGFPGRRKISFLIEPHTIIFYKRTFLFHLYNAIITNGGGDKGYIASIVFTFEFMGVSYL